MRCLVTYSAARFATPAADWTPEEVALVGMSPIEDSPIVVAWADPIENERERPEGEEAAGIPLHRHPELLLAQEPDLWAVIDRWRVGVTRELSRADYDAISGWEMEAWLTMRAAHAREERREIDRIRNREGEA